MNILIINGSRYAGFKIAKTIERGGTVMHPSLTDKDKKKMP